MVQNKEYLIKPSFDCRTSLFVDDPEICNDPHLCMFCANVDKWPGCISKDARIRGYHPIFKDCWDHIVECSNHDGRIG